MALTIRLLFTFTTLVTQSGLALCSSSNSRPEVPLVYVIKDEPQPNSIQQSKWDNQKLTIRNLVQEFPDPTDQRPAKQVAYSDIPSPYFHSYKYVGLTLDQNEQRQLQRWQENQYFSPSWGTKTGGTKTLVARNPMPTSVNKKQYPKPAHSDFPVAASDTTTSMREGNFSTSMGRSAGLGKKKLVCYYGSWAVYRPDAGKYPVENIDPFLCTHIIYGFTGLSFDNKIKVLDPYNDLEENYGKGAMKRFTNLKRINPDLKALVAIGGWNEGSIKYSKMASEPEARATFVKSVLDFLVKYNFDGLDLDWEYPGSRGGRSYDKQNFVKLTRELKEAFTPRNYLLTAAVSAGKWYIDPAYDIGQVAKYLDLINLMSYDYHGGWESKTGMNAPLFSSKVHDVSSKSDALLNVNWSVNYWIQNGAPAEKIMLGVGSYGRSFTLDKGDQNGINAPASQKGRAGPYTREPGSLGYNEICEAFQRKAGAWKIVRDPDYLAPYAYNKDERQWVGYDDPESIALKAQFVKSMNLGGMMMWSLETDDFSGRCHDGEKYPLLNSIRRVLDSSVIQQPGPLRPTPTSARPRPTQSTTPFREVEEDEQPSSTRRPVVPSRRPSSTRKPSPFSSTRRPSGSSSSSSRRPITSSTTSPAPPIVITSSTSRRPTTTTATTTTGEFVCKSDGMFADPSNCRKFIRCVQSANPTHYSIYRFDCGPGTAFNEAQSYCDHIYNVPNCSQNSGSAQLLRSRNWYNNQYQHHLNHHHHHHQLNSHYFY